MAQRGRPRKTPLPECTGEDLCIQLYGGLNLYGFACWEHGLRYVMQAHPGDAMSIGKAQPVNGAEAPDPVGRGIQCDICAESMAYAGRHGRGRKAPGEALQQLEQLAEAILEDAQKGGG